MDALSKFPMDVARQALRIAQRTLPLYSHRCSPKIYTQHQLFTSLVLKSFLKTDYRGICGILRDIDSVRVLLELNRIPHHTTLQKAAQRLLRLRSVRRLLRATIRDYVQRRRRVPRGCPPRLRRVAFDSTGLDYGRRSPYYTRRRRQGKKGLEIVTYTRFAKLEAAFDCDTHLLVGVLVGRGPRPDVDRFVPLLDATREVVQPRSILADAGYDSEPNHRYARDRHAIRSFMPATHGRPTKKLPTGRHRRHMKLRLNKDYGRYGQRWQAETAFSMLKRRIAVAVNARHYCSQARELWLLALTYNLMLLHVSAGFSTEQECPLLSSCFTEFGSVSRDIERNPSIQRHEPTWGQVGPCQTHIDQIRSGSEGDALALRVRYCLATIGGHSHPRLRWLITWRQILVASNLRSRKALCRETYCGESLQLRC